MFSLEVFSMVVSVELTNEEKECGNAYARNHGLSLSEAMKRAFFEKIEDEYDIALSDGLMREHEKNPKTYSHDEVKKILNL